MIKINHLNKYYNKSKNNEIHVIDDTSLELPSTGLICFIGKSGSGKSTLLNVIGGLDKADSGSISYDNLKMEKYNMKKMDLFRKNNVGYVFQNYLLIENKTVYDNLRIALEIIGIYDEAEKQKRIEYVLKSVGLFKYRKKLAGKLSGGEQQRVSIARSLLKKCSIIIADEPTGNLDSENTIEIMNILKKISENTLVLVVTHNKDVASFYADRIIELKDGCILNDNSCCNNEKLDIKNDRQIYLKDLNYENIDTNTISIDLYKDNLDELVDLRLVLKNGTIIVESSKPLVIKNQSNIDFIDDHYKHLDTDSIKDYNFDISFYKNVKTNSFSLFFNSLKKSFLSFFNVKKKERIFHIFFFCIGILIAICTILFSQTMVVNDYSFNDENNVYYTLNTNSFYYLSGNYDYSTAMTLIDNNLVDNIYKVNQNESEFRFEYNTQRSESVDFTCYIYPVEKNESEILIGELPIKKEVVISKKIADRIIKNINNIKNYSDIIGYPIILSSNYKFRVSGITNSFNNSIYVNNDYYYQNYFYNDYLYDTLDETSFIGYRYAFEYDITGNDITSKYEIIGNEDKFSIGDVLKYNDNTYTIVGTYKCINNYDILSISDDIIGLVIESNNIKQSGYRSNMIAKEKISYNIDTIRDSNSKDIVNENETIVNVNSNYKIGDYIDYDNYKLKVVGYYIGDSSLNIVSKKMFMKNYLSSHLPILLNISNENLSNAKEYCNNLYSSYDYMYKVDLNLNKDTMSSTLTISVILFIVSIIYVYFSTRSKMISQIKNIGVYRSIGASRFLVIKKYLVDIFMNTTLTSILGYLILIVIYSIIYTKLQSLIGNNYNIPIGIYLAGILVLYLINFIFGILPVLCLMRKTPAEINAKYDI